MRKWLCLLVLLIVGQLAAPKGEGYVFSTISGGAPLRWNLTDPATPIVQSGRIVYNLNPAGSDDLPFTQVEQAVASAFNAWEEVPTSNIAFTRGPNSSATGGGGDNVFQLYWLENGTVVEDGFDISGALAVTRVAAFASAPRVGEISDATLIFNGSQFRWATDGNADRIDIAEVATHEIGHAIGLSHSPIGAATMFPRTGEGSTRNRTLTTDDRIGISAAYPAANFAASTGTLRGRVSDGGNNSLFGAHIVVTNSDGVVIASALTLQDGTYALQGLPPGNYSVFAEPLDPPTGFFFSRNDLTGFWAGINTDFQTGGDMPVAVAAGAAATLDFRVTRGAPAIDAQLVYRQAFFSFSNLPVSVAQGQSNVTLGVAGFNLPQTGTPLSVSGGGVTILGTRFGSLSNGRVSVLIDANISPAAVPGPRNLIITGGGQRSIIVGAVEITGTSQPPTTINAVSAASFVGPVAPESLVAVFGNGLSPTTQVAAGVPLPTTLAGASVRLRDRTGTERFAPLFFVSPTQINLQVAPGIQPGPVNVALTNGAGATLNGTMTVETVAPGLFAANANGQGAALALALRVRANGTQSFEPTTRFDAAQQRHVPLPIELGLAGEQVFLVLFATGVRLRSALNNVAVRVGGTNQAVTFAGAQGSLIGVDQINARLERTLSGRGEVEVVLTVDGKVSNPVRVHIR